MKSAAYEQVQCNNVSTLPINVTEREASELAPLHHVIAGSIVFFVTFPLLLYNLRCFPIGTTVAALLGCFFMVVTTVVKQDEVYDIIGNPSHINVAVLLMSLMFLAQYIEREQLLVKLLRLVLKADHCFENYLWRVCLISAVFSAIFTSGAACAILTPLIVKYWDAQERTRQELLTILLAISTSANIGSALTVFGNMQMALIAAGTAIPKYSKSQLNMQTCLIYMCLPVFMAFLLNLLFLIFHYRIRSRRIENDKLISEASHSEQEMTGLTGSPKLNGFFRKENGYLNQESFERSIPCQLETIPEDDILEITEIHRSTELIDSDIGHANGDAVSCGSSSDSSEEDQSQQPASNSTSENLSTPSLEYRPSALTLQNMQEAQRQIQAQETASLDKKLEQHGVKLLQRIGLYRSLSGISMVEFLPSNTGLQQMTHTDSMDNVFTPADSTTFQVFLCLLVLIVFALSLASTSYVPFDTGLVALGGVVLALLFDSVLNHKVCMTVLQRVDCSVILLFFGVLVWTQGFINTQIPHWLWTKSTIAHNVSSPLYLLLFIVVVVVASFFFTGVPVTLVILDVLHPCKYQMPFVVYLAWCSTIVGNLTQLSSVAGISVAHKSQQAIKYKMTYWDYFKFGFPTTLVYLSTGCVILFGMLHVV